jgi:hypothetical protein
MSYSFKNYSAKSTFGVIKETQEAGDYILNKKNKLLNCNLSKKTCNKLLNCNPKPIYNVYNTAVNLPSKEMTDNKKYYNYNLNMNLITKLDLKNISVIEDVSGNICPTTIVYNNIPNFYNYYEIDPKGQLFGNTECGVNNFLSYLVYNPDL